MTKLLSHHHVIHRHKLIDSKLLFSHDNVTLTGQMDGKIAAFFAKRIQSQRKTTSMLTKKNRWQSLCFILHKFKSKQMVAKQIPIKRCNGCFPREGLYTSDFCRDMNQSFRESQRQRKFTPETFAGLERYVVEPPSHVGQYFYDIHILFELLYMKEKSGQKITKITVQRT